MAESSLSLGYPDFQARVGYYLGYGNTPGNWSTDQNTDVEDCIQSGLRMFYFLIDVPNAPEHDWSFLKPIISLAITSAASDYALPDDFGGIDGNITYASADNARETIEVVGEAVIRRYRQNYISVTGRPKYAAVVPLAGAGAVGQRFQLSFWPNVDGSYTPSFRYRSLVNKISSGSPYPLGGASHAETILACMLAKAELIKNDAKGEMWSNAIDHIVASIKMDRRGMFPEYYGYNGDASDQQGMNRFARTLNVTYKGVQY